MPRGVFNLAKRLRLSFDRPIAPEFTDASLLTRFLDKRDESAFTQLLERHAALVWGVCRRGLTNHVDAEDAFQATFLVLFQQAGRIRKQQSLASWLHGVAWRITRKMQRSQQRRQRREQLLAVTEAKNGKLAVDHSLSEVVDAELARMPMRYREPILLCYLHGQSQAAAAQTLGWPVGTVAGRLSRAKELLRSRLIRRGVAPAIAANFAIELAHAEVPAQLLEKTLHTIQIGGTPTVLLLAKGMVGTMLITKWLMAGVVGVGLTLAAGAGYSAWQGGDRISAPQENAKGVTPATANKAEESDYQKIQGRWRLERPDTNDRTHVEDRIFQGRTYTLRTYLVGSVSRAGSEVGPFEFVLDPNRTPKRMELQIQEPKTSPYQGNDKPIPARKVERMLCTYVLKDDTLTIVYDGALLLARNANRDIYGDRTNPQTLKEQFLTKDINAITFVYRRVPPNSNPVVDRQIAQVDAERKLVDERIAALDERFKLQYQSYKAGKELINFVLDSIRERLDSKMERAGMDQQQIQTALKEALASTNEMFDIVEAKYKQGSATQLELVTTKAAKLDYELRLLRLEKNQLEKQPK